MRTYLSLALFITVAVSAHAFSITSIGPYGSGYHAIDGVSHSSRVDTDTTFNKVEWYVDSALVWTDWNTSTTSVFPHTYPGKGSTSGNSVTVKAKAFDSGSSSTDEDSYTLTVWSKLESAASPSRSVVTQPKPGGSYSVTYSLTTPNANYTISRMEIYVDSNLVASQNYGDVTYASLNASGSLGLSVGQTARFDIKFWYDVASTVASIVTFVQNAVVRNTIYGTCTCSTEGNKLDNGEWNGDEGHFYNASTVKWDAGSLGGNGTRLTSWDGTYSFAGEIPVGYNVNLILTSEDTHAHGSPPTYVYTCEYGENRSLGQVGATTWFEIAWYGENFQENFNNAPDTVTYRP